MFSVQANIVMLVLAAVVQVCKDCLGTVAMFRLLWSPEGPTQCSMTQEVVQHRNAQRVGAQRIEQAEVQHLCERLEPPEPRRHAWEKPTVVWDTLQSQEAFSDAEQ